MSQAKNELRTLAETQKIFTDWRLTKRRGTRIPDELWSKAFELLPHFTVKKVAIALRLNNTDLKRRAVEAGVIEADERSKNKSPQAETKPKQKKNKFIEMVLPTTEGVPAKGVVDESGKGWLITLTRLDGTRLEIIPPEFNEALMHGLVRNFLGG